MAGYSGTPLAKKLGIKEGHTVALLGAPPGFTDGLRDSGMDESVAVRTSLRGKCVFDVIVFFTKKSSELEMKFETLKGRLETAGGLWVAWPKKASKVPTDMTEDAVRDVALPGGLVDNKVCAIDEVWSGLRLVRRKKDR